MGCRMIGSDNPSWKGGQIDKICEKCKKEYKVYPYRKNSRFCSRKCSNQVTLNNKGRRGITRINSGYLMKYIPEHPNNSNGYVLLHRLVMEEYLDRYLTKEEVVHHINKDITDNRIENLELMSNQSVHLKREWEIGSFNNRRNR